MTFECKTLPMPDLKSPYIPLILHFCDVAHHQKLLMELNPQYSKCSCSM